MNKTEVKIPEMLFFQEGPGVRNTQYTSSGVKLLNVANLVDGKVDLSTSYRYISEDEAYGKYRHFLCDEGDFIVASSGIKVDYIDKKMGFISREMLPLCMNTSTIRFKVLDDSKLNIKYFMYFLKSTAFKKQLAKQITGSAQLNYGPSHLKQMTFPLIDIKIQNDLVQKLDSIMRIIDQKNTSLKKLDELVKARFVEMFDDNFGEIVELGNVCDVRDGTHDSPKYHNEGYPLVTSKNICDGKIDFSTCNLIQKEDYAKINKRSKVDVGDVLMPMIGTVGNPIIVNTDKEFAIKNVALIKFKDDSVILNTFIKTLLESDYFGRAVLSKTKGGTQKFISLGDIRKLEFNLPSIELQHRFATFVAQVDKSKFTLSNELAMCNFYVRLINDSITHSRIDLRMSE